MKLHQPASTCIAIFLLASSAVAQQGKPHCGTERWAVKTSADIDAGKVNPVPIITTVANLAAIPAPSRAELAVKPDSRFGEELRTYTVQAYLDGFKLEGDIDFHIGIVDLNDPSATIVTEMPSESCVPAELRNEAAMLRASWQARFGKATKKFKKLRVHKIKVEITGIGFFDFIHGQTDVAKNGFELHRIIAWKEVL